MADKWTIDSQILQTNISDTGPGFTPVWKVTYHVTTGPATGTKGYVNVPAETYNAATVKAAIDAAVYHIDQVGGL